MSGSFGVRSDTIRCATVFDLGRGRFWRAANLSRFATHPERLLWRISSAGGEGKPHGAGGQCHKRGECSKDRLCASSFQPFAIAVRAYRADCCARLARARAEDGLRTKCANSGRCSLFRVQTESNLNLLGVLSAADRLACRIIQAGVTRFVDPPTSGSCRYLLTVQGYPSSLGPGWTLQTPDPIARFAASKISLPSTVRAWQLIRRLPVCAGAFRWIAAARRVVFHFSFIGLTALARLPPCPRLDRPGLIGATVPRRTPP